MAADHVADGAGAAAAETMSANGKETSATVQLQREDDSASLFTDKEDGAASAQEDGVNNDDDVLDHSHILICLEKIKVKENELHELRSVINKKLHTYIPINPVVIFLLRRH